MAPAKTILPMPRGYDASRHRSTGLESAQEIEDVLLPRFRERVEVGDHGVRLRWRKVLVAGARMGLDRLQQVRRSPVVQEEDPLPEPPQGRGPKLVAPRVSLEDVAGQSLLGLAAAEPGSRPGRRHPP